MEFKEKGRFITNKRTRKKKKTNHKTKYNDRNRQTAKRTIYRYIWVLSNFEKYIFKKRKGKFYVYRHVVYTLVVNGGAAINAVFVYVNESNSFWSIFIRSCLSQSVNLKGSLVNSPSKFDVSLLLV